MPPPDQSDDFSHLPTIDDGQEEARQRKEALWAKNRRLQTAHETPAAAGDLAPAEPTPAPAPVVIKPPVQYSDDWRALLEMEPEDPRYSMAHDDEAPPAPTPAAPPVAEERPRIRVNKTVVRPQQRPENSGTTASPPPLPPAQPKPPPLPPVSKPPLLPPEPRGAPCVKPPVRAPASAAENSPEALRRDDAPPKQKDPSADADKGNSALAKDGEAPAKSATEKTPALAEGEKVKIDETEKSAWRQRWEKMGGLALTLSVGAHLLLVGAATVWVVSRSGESAVDFLPGGSSQQSQAAAEALEHQIKQKKTPWLKKSAPMARIAAANKISDITLPDMQPDLLDMPKASNLMAAPAMSGLGGGFGAGIGRGARGGVTFAPFSLFGHAIQAKRLAVVLDISTSMTEHLPRVVQEVDRAARGSVVICYFGCGLDPPPGGRKFEGDEVFRTSGIEFEKYWRQGGATLEDGKTYKINPKDPIPNEDVFRLLSKRPQTFFIHSLGVGYTWKAILSNELRTADALYWFSDFEDHVDFRQLAIVQENLKNRKQKLYIHPYEHGSSYDLVRTQLVEPTGGDVIDETGK